MKLGAPLIFNAPLGTARPGRVAGLAGVPTPAALAAWWVVAGAVMLTALGTPPVSRTQEARVLETAREMLETGRGQWLIPHVNGRPRMRKPPLAYWVTAASYGLFGVGEAQGRLPAVLAGWLTVGLVAHTASRLFSERAGFFAGASLLGCALFFRHARLAETDVLAMLFVTAAVYAIWRGCDRWPRRDNCIGPEPTSSAAPAGIATRAAGGAGWLHAAAASMALAALAKGPPAAYPMLFLIVWSVLAGRLRNLWRFVLCGAPLTFIVVAAPWFALTASDPSSGQLIRDLGNSVEGGKGHWDWPHVYVHQLAAATAPWTGVLAVAVVAAARRARGDRRLRGLLVWVAVILVPLCFWGNKQRHYLMTVLPPLTILIGWLVDEALRAPREHPLARAARAVAAGTVAACALAVPSVILAGRLVRGNVAAQDLALAAAISIALAATLLVARRRGTVAASVTFATANVSVFLLVFAMWAPSLQPDNARTIADAIRARYSDGAPLAFVQREDLAIVFYFRRVIPVTRTDADLADLAARTPGLVAIQRLTPGHPDPTPLLVEQLRFAQEDTLYVVGPVVKSGLRRGGGALTDVRGSAPTTVGRTPAFKPKSWIMPGRRRPG